MAEPHPYRDHLGVRGAVAMKAMALQNPWLDPSLLCVADRVRDHARRALALGRMEPLPPGYTSRDWCLYLVDKSEKDLQVRYFLRSTDLLCERPWMSPDRHTLLGVFAPEVPAELATKMRSLSMEWKEDLFRKILMWEINRLNHCSLRGPALLAAGQVVVDGLEYLLKGHWGPWPWRATVDLYDGHLAVGVREVNGG